MGPDTGRVSIPSWKLELIKNRRSSKTSSGETPGTQENMPRGDVGNTLPTDANPTDTPSTNRVIAGIACNLANPFKDNDIALAQ